VLRNPYPFYEQLREAGPVVHLSHYNVWAFARYEQVKSTLNRWEQFCSVAGVGLANFRKEKPWRPPSLLLENDPPAHSKYRGVITTVMSRQSLKDLRPHFEAVAEKLIDDLIRRGTFDGACDLAEVYPLEVFPDAVGVDEAGREHLLAYGAMAFNAFGPRNELLNDALKKAEPVVAYIASRCRRDALRPGSFGSQIYEAADAEKVSEADAALLVRSMLTAGVDTTVSGLSAALILLAQNPDQWQALRADPELARSAFDEAIRLESPVQTFYRTTTQDIVIDGVPIAEGEKVLMFLGSANRDPRRWADAARFDIRRNTTGHVAFGGGIHGCVGQMIARLEGEIVLSLLAKRARLLELTSPPVVRPNNTLRGWSSIPLRIGA
jgi:cytochrome P450